MAEPTNDSDFVYFRDPLVGGVVKVPTAAASQAAERGLRPVGEKEALESAQASKDLAYVDQNWGVPGQLAYGVGKGLTLGLGPGLAVKAGLVSPGIVQAADTSLAAMAGDVAGTIAPALISGGESLAARGAALTPAGLMGSAGGLAERFAGELIGETSSILGRAASAPARMAARGAAEGAVMNLGHQVGENLVQNKPFAAEAMAALADGALYGGLLGGGIGTVGALGEKALEGVSNFGRKFAGDGVKATMKVSRRLGMEASAEELVNGAADAKIRDMVTVLREGGSDVGDSALKQFKAARTVVAAKEGIRKSAVEVMNAQAPTMTPGFSKIEGRLWTDIIEPVVQTPARDAVMKEVQGVRKELETVWKHTNIDPVQIPAITEERLTQVSTANRPSKFSTVEVEPGYEVPGMRVATGENPTWKNLIKFRDDFESRATTPVRKEVLKILDSQIQESMELAAKSSVVDAVKSAAKEYASSTASLKVGRELETNVGRMLAGSKDTSVGGISSKDIGVSGVVALSGSPMTAAGYIGAKGLGNQLQSRLDGWMAQLAYDQSIANTAAAASQKAKDRIGKALDNFLKPAKSAVKGASKAAQKVSIDAARSAKNSKVGGSTRAEYEAMADRVQTLLSNNHAARVQRQAEAIRAQGYHELADAMTALNQRAVMYTMNAMPPRKGAQGLRSLRPIPVSESLDLEEHRFKRIMDGIQNPLGLMDDLENGSLSTDAVRAAWNVNPEFRTEVVEQTMTKIAEMKANGDYLPMDKITGLSILLDAPLDRIVEPDYVAAVQSTLVTPPPQGPTPQGPPPQPAGINTGGTPGALRSGLLTPLQSQMV